MSKLIIFIKAHDKLIISLTAAGCLIFGTLITLISHELAFAVVFGVWFILCLSALFIISRPK